MTNEQKATIQSLHREYETNCLQYAGFNVRDYCQFETLRDEQLEDDHNIVVIISSITGTDDFGLPETEIKNFFVEPNGHFYLMDMMPDVFQNQNEVMRYISKLTKFDYNGE